MATPKVKFKGKTRESSRNKEHFYKLFRPGRHFKH